jgi:hypoxia up-regulated 1
MIFKVTPFANQFERQAILDAAELAGLNVLTLMHDETAGKF